MKSAESKSPSRRKKKPAKKRAAPGAGAFPVVAIGASAGGLEAYKEFFEALPADTGMAFVLIQHLDPTHHSLLAEILSKSSRIPVHEVKAGTTIAPNCVYVIPPDAFMAIKNGAFVLTPRKKESGQSLSVNFFMRSLAEEYRSRAIGVILSGTGADGTLGLENIKAEGGITFAQDPQTAKYDGMPQSALQSGGVDFVLAPKAIAKELHRIQQHPYVQQDVVAAEEAGEEEEPAAAPSEEKGFLAILDQLRRSSGVDFRQYKPTTIHRRALRRAMILKLDSLGQYAGYLREHPEEAARLYDDVLIPVTSFFRDLEAFETMKNQVYPAITKDKSNKETIRMWAPGCSTGEETYSLAMTLLEFLGEKAPSYQIQIFGTDLNEKGIQKARTGMYRESIAEEISPERMQRFFVKTDEGYRVNKAVRDMCVFARHDLANDPPFSQMNVVACRNLLIYLQPVLQKKIIPILHYALKTSGFLFLGGTESVASFPDLFSSVDKKHRLYSKRATTSRLHYDFTQKSYLPSGKSYVPEDSEKSMPPRIDFDVQVEADRAVLKSHTPPGVVINRELEVVQFRGQTAPYLAPAPGKPSLNVLKLARNGLSVEIRSLVGAARKKGALVRREGVPFDESGRRHILDLSVLPLGQKGAGEAPYFVVLFEDVTARLATDGKHPDKHSGGAAKGSSADRQEVQRLKRELADTQDTLRLASESEDSLKEEFQSANEEILSANEELQSTNEELETSKEELQSANEELSTLNAELGQKNNELHDLNNDISNFLNSTRIPVVMLDRQLRIRRVTPMADTLLKARPTDIGRPISDIRLKVDVPHLESMIAAVLETLQPVEREVRGPQGHWYSLSILPYRTQDNKIDGVVLALQDIDPIKAANTQLKRTTEFLRGVVDTVANPLLVLDAQLRIVLANEPFLRTFQVATKEAVNCFFYNLGGGQWNIPELRTLLEEALPKRKSVRNFSVEREFENLGSRTMLINAEILSSLPDEEPMILLAIEDISERKRMELSAGRLAAIVESSDDGIISMNLDGVIETWNTGAERMFGHTRSKPSGRTSQSSSHRTVFTKSR